MKHLTSILAFALLAVSPLALADTKANDPKTTDKASAKLSDGDAQAIAELHHANQSEIDMANYATAHGTKAVKDYAALIVKDHTANDKDLTALAKKKGLATIPMPSAMDDADDMAKLKAKSGADLDKLYIDMMVADHQKDVAKVTAAIGTIADADVKAHFTSTKPALEKHLDAAKKVQTTLSAQASK